MSGEDKREFQMYIVDAFTTKDKDSGNPAAVCLVDQELSDEECGKIAEEMNLSETAFIRKLDPSHDFKTGNEFGLRWWTPARKEVVLCGHATLAAAFTLIHHCGNDNPALTFQSRFSGILTVTKVEEGLQLDFPLRKVEKVDILKDHLARKMSQIVDPFMVLHEALFADRGGFNNLILVYRIRQNTMDALKVDTKALLAADPEGKSVGLVTITSCHGAGYDFISRVFAPFYGVPEDPVTGSAHSPLAVYWSEELGKTKMRARQCSARGGEVGVEVKGGRVLITGSATPVRPLTYTLPK